MKTRLDPRGDPAAPWCPMTIQDQTKEGLSGRIAREIEKKDPRGYSVLRVIDCKEHYLIQDERAPSWTASKGAASRWETWDEARAYAAAMSGLVVECATDQQLLSM